MQKCGFLPCLRINFDNKYSCTMNKFFENIENWAKDNWDDISILLFIGLPSGLLCLIFFGCLDFTKLF